MIGVTIALGGFGRPYGILTADGVGYALMGRKARLRQCDIRRAAGCSAEPKPQRSDRVRPVRYCGSPARSRYGTRRRVRRNRQDRPLAGHRRAVGAVGHWGAVFVGPAQLRHARRFRFQQRAELKWSRRSASPRPDRRSFYEGGAQPTCRRVSAPSISFGSVARTNIFRPPDLRSISPS